MAIKTKPWAVLATFAASSGDGSYEVRLSGDGNVYCTCPGWRFNKKCKHLDAYAARKASGEESKMAAKTARVFKDGLGKQLESTLTDNEAIDLLKQAAKKKDFAKSLLGKYATYGTFTERQLYWAHKLAGEELEAGSRPNGQPAEVEDKPIEEIGGKPIIEMFTAAQSKLTWPKLFFDFEDTPIMLMPAGKNSRNPGCVYVSNGKRRPLNTWYGMVRPDGTYYRTFECPDEIVAFLKVLAADPSGIVGQAGRKSGNCCFCRKALTDERSVKMGYGPSCARNFALPWGSSL